MNLRVLLGAPLVLLSVALAGPDGEAADLQPTGVPVNLSGAKIVDLSHPFDEKTIYWPNAPSGFVLHRESFGKTPAGYFYATNDFCAPEHGGTHLDAPIHFSEGKWTVDQIPLRQLIGPGVVIDVTAQSEKDHDYRLSLDDVRTWEKRHGPVPAGAILILRTGWSKRWPDKKAYLGDDTPGRITNLHFPSYGRDAAEFLVRERKIGALPVVEDGMLVGIISTTDLLGAFLKEQEGK